MNKLTIIEKFLYKKKCAIHFGILDSDFGVCHLEEDDGSSQIWANLDAPPDLSCGILLFYYNWVDSNYNRERSMLHIQLPSETASSAFPCVPMEIIPYSCWFTLRLLKQGFGARLTLATECLPLCEGTLAENQVYLSSERNPWCSQWWSNARNQVPAWRSPEPFGNLHFAPLF